MKRIVLQIFFALSSLLLVAQSPIQITNEKEFFRPLDTINFHASGKGTLVIMDAHNRQYYRGPFNESAQVAVTGYPGVQQAILIDKKGREKASVNFSVKCETTIEDRDSTWNKYFNLLKWNIFKPGEMKIIRYHDRTYFLFSDWIRDHVNILKGKKYFFDYLKDAIDLFAENQLSDGMIFDFCMPINGQVWEERFHNRDFIRVDEKEGHFFQRVPAENDVEYWFVQGLYQTWKATGDDEWMENYLDNAERALHYDMHSPYTWSTKYQLIKRPFTIDTWDFQPAGDAALVGGDVMESVPGKTRYGIMHGDNTGFAQSCYFLAQMYEYSGNTEKATFWKKTGDQILDRLNKLSWNGNFYTHFVDENDNVVRDLGTDPETQVSLSNTYDLNRGIDHEKAKAIIKTYMAIRDSMPASSPGEFYGIYPPFEKGFAMLPWHYVNGGVFPFIAGELSKGAFENGFENYGVNIHRRIDELLAKNNGDFPYYWIGKIPDRPKTDFTKLDLTGQANTSFSGNLVPEAVSWTQEGPDNDMSMIPKGELVYDGVPFQVIDPGDNHQKSCIGLAAKPPYAFSADVTVNRKAHSLYILHTMAGSGLAGSMEINYADGSSFRTYVSSGKQVANWWNPVDLPYNRNTGWTSRVAWHGQNPRSEVGVYAWTLDNPYPGKKITDIRFTHSGLANKWFILAVTLSDKPSYFTWPTHTGTWLVNWNASALVSSMIEGLAGIRDMGVAYSSVEISPRWTAAGTNDVYTVAKYEASGAYTAYHLQHPDKNAWMISLAGVAKQAEINFLLPPGKTVKEVTSGGVPLSFDIRTVEQSHYCHIKLDGYGAKTVVITTGDANQ